MEAKEQLLRLLRIQELALASREARTRVERAPARVEEIEERFRERNAEYVTIQARFDELELDQRLRNQEVDDLEEAKRKYTEQLMQVKNQREYAAVLKEIDAVKAGASEHEDAILRDMEEIESIRGDLESRASHIQEERAKVEHEVAQVEADAAISLEHVRALESERQEIESELSRDLVDNIRRVEEYRQGIFLARAESQVCQSCYVRVRPQVFQEIRAATRIHSCGNCRRFLYYEPSLRPRQAEAPTAAAHKLGALNGGPV